MRRREEKVAGTGVLEGWRTSFALVPITLIAALILGYHPYSEDGGIYLAEIKHALDPGLYPHDLAFVAGHLGASGFTSGVAWMVRSFGFRVDAVMLGIHLLCIFGVLLGARRLARLCYHSVSGQWGAVAAVALCPTIPVAGTSLLLMDPYVTARSVSLALTLLGLGGLAEFLVEHRTTGRWTPPVWGVLAFAGSAWAHPLMGGYGFGAAAVLVVAMSRRRWVRVGGTVGFGMLAIAIAWYAQWVAPAETADYTRVAATRYYWFLSQWQWFEWAGLVSPMGLLGWIGWKGRGSFLEGGLARMAFSVGGIALVIALLFAREGGAVHAVARMQPLRGFLVVYVVLFLLLGARLGEKVLRQSVVRWVLATGAMATLMVAVQRETYPASGHLELPGGSPRNAWERAFLWARDNTPNNALFALDRDYIHKTGEDAQSFRAVAERSALPDYSKDGGQAAIRPELTEAWVLGQKAQEGLTEETDQERMQALRPLGATWIVILREGVTGFSCPYQNDRVKICILP